MLMMMMMMMMHANQAKLTMHAMLAKLTMLVINNECGDDRYMI